MSEDTWSLADAEALDRAARVLTRRSKRPNGVWLRAICHVLTDTADAVRREYWARKAAS